MSKLKIIGIITLILVLIVIGVVIFYFFYWRGKHNRSNNDNDDEATDETKPPTDTSSGSSDDGDGEITDSSANINKWQEFKENKKNNFIKISNDINIETKPTTATANNELDFNELFHKPYESNDDLLFELESVDNIDSNNTNNDNMSIYEAETDSINNDEIDINILDNINDFDKRGFKNIEEVITTANDETTNNINNIQLINSELF